MPVPMLNATISFNMLTVTLPPNPDVAITPLPAFWLTELPDISVRTVPPEEPSDRTPPPLLLSMCERSIDTLVAAPLAGAIITPTLLFRTDEFSILTLTMPPLGEMFIPESPPVEPVPKP